MTVRASRDIDDLIAIMAALRTPATGCPWDLEQDFRSIAPYTIEETYEVVDAIERGDMPDLREELGDLLLQVVFHARMAQEAGHFDFGGVVEAITTKLVRRHPHVFGDARDLHPAEVEKLWGRIKAEEKAERRAARAAAGLPADPHGSGLLSDVPAALPALARALKLQRKAATVGFDWNDPRLVLDKIREETGEIDAALSAKADKTAIEGEIGDLLFAVVNLARHLHIDPDAALRSTNAKFERRFGFVESELAKQGVAPAQAGLDAMEALWTRAKEQEKTGDSSAEASSG